MRGPPQLRGPALNWLNAAASNHPRRPDIAKQLDAMVDEAMNPPFGNDDAPDKSRKTISEPRTQRSGVRRRAGDNLPVN